MVGFRTPPKGSQFRKGQSGNPHGRPRGSSKLPPYESVLGQKVTVREGGRQRQVSAAEGFLLHVTQQGLEGDSQAARAATMAIAEARSRSPYDRDPGVTTIVLHFITPGSVDSATRRLKMTRKIDPYRDSVKMKIEPWLVQLALERLGDRTLTTVEQAEVYAATRTPHKVAWPDWWTVAK